MTTIAIVGIPIAVLLFLLAVVNFLMRGAISTYLGSVLGKVPVVSKLVRNKMIFSIGLIVIAVFMVGSLGGLWSQTTGIFGVGTATTSGTEAGQLPGISSCVVDAVEYSAIASNTGFDTANYTFTADTSDKSNYYVDASNSSSVVNATIEITGNWTIRLKNAPATGGECGVKYYIVGPSFKDENSIGASANDIYDLFDSARSVSDLQGLQYGNRVSSVQFEQDAWLDENNAGIAAAGMDRELTVLSFTAGEGDTKLGYTFDLEATAYQHINKGSSFKIYFVRQVGDKPSASDPIDATLTLRKGALT